MVARPLAIPASLWRGTLRRAQWLTRMVRVFDARILPIDVSVADRWGKLNVLDPVPTGDGLLAATALAHGLVLVTRNLNDISSTGVRTMNPFRQ